MGNRHLEGVDSAPAEMPRRAEEKATFSKFVDITPEIAAEWLKNNHSNRKIRENRVSKLVRDMKVGQWKVNGETIKFDSFGRLFDGQHRLTACVKSGVTIRSLVVFNAPSDGYTTVDIGANKSFSDFLSPNGEKNSVLLAATVNWLALVEIYGDIWHFRGTSPTMREREETLEKYPQIRESVNYAASAGRIIGLLPSMVAFGHFVATRNGEREKFEDFIHQVLTGQGLRHDDPAYVLREWLIGIRRSQKKSTKSEYLIAMFIKCWNYFRAGRKSSSIRIREDEALPNMVIENPLSARPRVN
jgi:hypothetical protein